MVFSDFELLLFIVFYSGVPNILFCYFAHLIFQNLCLQDSNPFFSNNKVLIKLFLVVRTSQKANGKINYKNECDWRLTSGITVIDM